MGVQHIQLICSERLPILSILPTLKHIKFSRLSFCQLGFNALVCLVFVQYVQNAHNNV